jgi:alkylation response protein AidB-like acyl-CoA dehydrogenase
MATALCIGTSYAYLGDRAVEEIFSGGGRLPVMAGQGHPNGIGVAHDGGYVLNGRWSYASGIKHSEYVYTAGFVNDERGDQRLMPDGAPEVRVFVIPVEKIELGGNWDVMGLRATGSIDYAIEDVFVPEAYTHIAATTAPLRGGSFYTLGLGAIAMIGHTGFAMGTIRRTLDELAAIAQAKAEMPTSIAHSESFLERYAVAEGNFRAARALVYETWRDIRETLLRGEQLSTRQRTMIFLSLNRVTWIGQEVTMFAYLASGGIGLRASTLQRFFRDMHAGTQHFLVAPPILRQCGRELAGLASDGVWRGFELVDAPPV